MAKELVTMSAKEIDRAELVRAGSGHSLNAHRPLLPDLVPAGDVPMNVASDPDLEETDVDAGQSREPATIHRI